MIEGTNLTIGEMRESIALDNARVEAYPLTFQKGHNLGSYEVVMHIDDACHGPVSPQQCSAQPHASLCLP